MEKNLNYFLLVLLPHLDCYIQLIGIIGFVISLIACLIKLHDVFDAYNDDDLIEAKSVLRKTAKIPLAFLLLSSLSIPIPNKREIIQLKAITVLSEIKGLDQIPQKLIDRLNDLLDPLDTEKSHE